MKEIVLFYLEDCPYCRYARRAAKELAAENGKYGVKIAWVEESRRPDVAARYDYYYVPTVFYGTEKLYEARPGETYAEVKRHLREALDEISSRTE